MIPLGSAKEKMPLSRALFYVIILVAGVLRVVYLRDLRADDPFFHVPVVDSATYHAWGQRIASGDLLGSQSFYLAPGYPYLLGFIYSLFGMRMDVVYLVQMIMDMGIIWALWWMARRAFGDGAGLLAALLWAFFRFAPFYAGKISAETPGVFFLVMSMATLVAAMERGSYRWATGSGLLLGIAVIIRAFLLLLIPVLLIAVFASGGFRRRGAVGAGVLLGCGLIILCVTMRNVAVTGQWTLISTNGGLVLYAGNNPQARGLPTHIKGISPNVDEQWRQVQQRLAGKLGHRPTPGEVDAYWRGKVWAFIKENPLKFLELLLRKALLSLSDNEFSDMYFASYERRQFTPSLGLFWVTMALLVPAGLVGVWMSSGRPFRLVLLAPLVSTAAVLVAFSVTERYRFIGAPFLCVFAAFAISNVRACRGSWLLAAALVAWMVVDVRALGLERRGFPPELHYNTGYAYLEMGRPKPAADEFRRALELRPDYPEAVLNLGNSLYAMGRAQEAVSMWKRALQLRPGYGLALRNLADALEKGHPNEARRYREAYEKALKEGGSDSASR